MISPPAGRVRFLSHPYSLPFPPPALQHVLPFMRHVPVAVSHRLTHARNQLEQMVALGSEALLGLRLETLNAHALQGADLFFAQRLVVVRGRGARSVKCGCGVAEGEQVPG